MVVTRGVSGILHVYGVLINFFDCPPVRYPSPCCVMTSVMKPFSVLKLYRMVFASYDVPLSSNMGLPMISPIESGVPTAYTVVESISISISLASSLMLPYTIFPSPYMYALFLPVSTIESLAEKSTVLSRSTFVRTILLCRFCLRICECGSGVDVGLNRRSLPSDVATSSVAEWLQSNH